MPTAFARPAQEVTPGPGSPDSQHFTSRNWAGYITFASSKGTDFNDVTATWVQPKVRCEATQATTVFWVGLDGAFDGTVEQGGSFASCPTAGGAPTYFLWWEMYPTNAVQPVVGTNAGDTITANVAYHPATSSFTITVRDLTTGHQFSKRERCGKSLACRRSSADVITEDAAGSGANGFLPLADYGKVTYTKVSIQDVAGHAGSISAPNWLNGAITEAAGGTTYATVTSLSAAGHTFSTIWKHA
jgi:hypothetical protein